MVKDDNFTYIIPDYKVKAGKQSRKITQTDIDKLKVFLAGNDGLIDDLYNDKITFDVFLDKLKSYNKIVKDQDNSDTINEYYEHNPRPNSKHIATMSDMTISDEDEYLSTYGEKTHGIENIVMWMGHTSDDMVVVKVCNDYNNWRTNLFTVYLPSLEIRGDVSLPLETLNDVMIFLKKNTDKILEYSLVGYSESDDYLWDILEK